MNRLLGFSVVVVVVAICGLWFVRHNTVTVMAQDLDRVPIEDGATFTIQPESAEFTSPFSLVTDPKQAERQTLQARFVQLATSRAEKMTTEELKQAVAEAERHDSEIAARRKLEQAKSILNEISTSYPDSEAAKVAGRVRQILEPPEPERLDGPDAELFNDPARVDPGPIREFPDADAPPASAPIR